MPGKAPELREFATKVLDRMVDLPAQLVVRAEPVGSARLARLDGAAEHHSPLEGETEARRTTASRRATLRGLHAAPTGTIPANVFASARADGDTDTAKNMRAQPSDLLVQFRNEGAGPIITPSDVKCEALQFLARPFAPANKIVHGGWRLNLTLVMRFGPQSPSGSRRSTTGRVANIRQWSGSS